MQNDGILIVVSGFSGVGKGTLMKELLKRWPEEYALSISATSRKPREGETDGREYFFRTREEFEQMLREDRLIEYNEYNGNYYGTPKDYVLSEMSAGRSVILEIDVNGGLQIREKFPEAMLVFVIPPDARALFDRLVNRGTEKIGTILDRMSCAVKECDYVSRYDMVVTNDDFETCLNELHTAFTEKKAELARRSASIDKLRKDIAQILEEENYNAASVL